VADDDDFVRDNVSLSLSSGDEREERETTGASRRWHVCDDGSLSLACCAWDPEGFFPVLSNETLVKDAMRNSPLYVSNTFILWVCSENVFRPWENCLLREGAV